MYVPILSTLQRLMENETVTSEVSTSKNTISHFVLVNDIFTYFHFRSRETIKVEILTFFPTFVMVMRSNPTPSFQSTAKVSKFCSTMMT